MFTLLYVMCCYYTRDGSFISRTPGSVGDPSHFGADPDPTPSFSDLKEAKKKSYFFLQTYPQAHYLQS